MKAINLWHIGLFALLLALLSPVFFVFSSVSAASNYDNLIQPIDSLKTTDIENGGDEQDITSSWTTIMQEKCGASYDLYAAALSDPNGKWAIVQGNNLSYKSVQIGWTTDPEGSTYFSETPSQRTIYVDVDHTVSIIQYQNEFYCNTDNTANAQFWLGADGENITGNLNVFLSTFPVEYPEGYEGNEIPQTHEVLLDKLYYKIVDKLGEFTPKNVDKNKFTKCELFIDDNPAQENDDAVNEATYEIKDCSSTVSHQFPSYGYYYVRLELTQLNGQIRQYSHTFHVDGSTQEGELDSTGVTESTAINYEDCTVYGVDIVGGIGCHFRNFGKWLQNLLITLFVPTNQQFASIYNEANEYLHQKLGLLLYPFDWLFLLFSSFLSAANSCSGPNLSAVPSVQSNATFFGSHVNLNVCSAEQNFPLIYNIAAFFIRVVAVLGMVFACYRKLLVTLNDHQSNGQGRGEALWG